MRRPARTILAAASLTVVALALTACTPPAPLPLPSSSRAASPTPSASPRLSVQAAAGAALRQTDSGAVVSVDDESDGTVWDVRVVVEDGGVQQLHLAASSGAVLAGPSSEPTDADAQSANRALVAAASVTLNDAATRMLAAVPKGRITAIDLSTYQDRVVWRGDVTNARGVRQDVRIDAVNGSVLLNLTDGQGSSGGS